MATFVATTSNLIGGSGTSVAGTSRSITAGNCAIALIGWEAGVTLSSVTDSVGATWSIAVQRSNAGTPAEPNGAIAYCANHPGGTVTVTANFSGSAAFVTVDLQQFTGGAGGLDGTPTSSQGSAASSFTCGAITTTGAGFVVQWLVGYQLCAGVTSTGSSPAFTRDTATENASSTAFGQYLLSASAQTVTPGATWSAATDRYVFMAAAFTDSGGSPPPPPPSPPLINRGARRAVFLRF